MFAVYHNATQPQANDYNEAAVPQLFWRQKVSWTTVSVNIADIFKMYVL